MEKLSDEQMKAEAERILNQYAPPDDAKPGESLEAYKERKRQEALTNMSRNPQMTRRPF